MKHLHKGEGVTMFYYQLLMSSDKELDIKTLNNVAVNYFELGLWDLSYQIWDELYHGIQSSPENYSVLLPVISCNMGNALRQTGYYEEAYRVLMQGLKRCCGTGAIYAMPELVMQLSILRMKQKSERPWLRTISTENSSNPKLK